MESTAATTIEVYADIWCTFAHVGLRMADEHRRASGRADVRLHVRAWPLEWVNGAPMDPQKVADHVAELQEHVAPTMFQHVDVEHFPTSTIDALALVARAYRAGDEVGERASFMVRNALFEEGRDIADPAVLSDLGARLGIGAPDQADRDAVRAEYEAGQAKGVIGSPHFFCGGENAFCPSLQITRGEDALIIHADADRLTEFLQHCLTTPE
jgi:predicted DsbA family dithiol-disulfide isomerase